MELDLTRIICPVVAAILLIRADVVISIHYDHPEMSTASMR